MCLKSYWLDPRLDLKDRHSMQLGKTIRVCGLLLLRSEHYSSAIFLNLTSKWPNERTSQNL